MAQLDRTLEILARLIAFPTISRDSNLALIDWVQELLDGAGFEVTRFWSPDRCKAGLFARIGPAEVRGVCLSAHTDVVPIDGQDWTYPPFALTRSADRVFGRGTTDMKGFLACALAAAEEARGSGLRAPLSLSISYDEEVGCVGIRQMMPQLAPLIGRPRAVFVGEPTSMQVATGHKGKTALKARCYGQPGHSALSPKFVNAIHVAARFVQQMEQLQQQLAHGPADSAYAVPYSTVHIGRLKAGRALNMVPEVAELELEFRHLPQISADAIRREIDKAAGKVSDTFPDVPRMLVQETNAYPGLETAADSAVVPWACALAQSTDRSKVAFGTEAGFFAGLGLETVVIGPGDMASDGHKPDEGVSLSELAACHAMMRRLLADLSA